MTNRASFKTHAAYLAFFREYRLKNLARRRKAALKYMRRIRKERYAKGLTATGTKPKIRKGKAWRV